MGKRNKKKKKQIAIIEKRVIYCSYAERKFKWTHVRIIGVKVWNAARMHMSTISCPIVESERERRHTYGKWLLARLLRHIFSLSLSLSLQHTRAYDIWQICRVNAKLHLFFLFLSLFFLLCRCIYTSVSSFNTLFFYHAHRKFRDATKIVSLSLSSALGVYSEHASD